MIRPIKLTKKQKEKLLEMVKFFYPKLQDEAYNEGIKYYGSKEEADANYCGFYITGDNNIQCSYPIDERDDSYHEHLIERIHWFEFTVMHLVDKVAFYACKDTMDYVVFTGHPVDYLYNIFNNVKK
jgi:hypothetical protein